MDLTKIISNDIFKNFSTKIRNLAIANLDLNKYYVYYLSGLASPMYIEPGFSVKMMLRDRPNNKYYLLLSNGDLYVVDQDWILIARDVEIISGDYMVFLNKYGELYELVDDKPKFVTNGVVALSAENNYIFTEDFRAISIFSYYKTDQLVTYKGLRNDLAEIVADPEGGNIFDVPQVSYFYSNDYQHVYLINENGNITVWHETVYHKDSMSKDSDYFGWITLDYKNVTKVTNYKYLTVFYTPEETYLAISGHDVYNPRLKVLSSKILDISIDDPDYENNITVTTADGKGYMHNMRKSIVVITNPDLIKLVIVGEKFVYLLNNGDLYFRSKTKLIATGVSDIIAEDNKAIILFRDGRVAKYYKSKNNGDYGDFIMELTEYKGSEIFKLDNHLYLITKDHSLIRDDSLLLEGVNDVITKPTFNVFTDIIN